MTPFPISTPRKSLFAFSAIFLMSLSVNNWENDVEVKKQSKQIE
jgi:hypothetical protein